MDLLGQRRVSYDAIRSLAIECHAWDIAAYHLLIDSTHVDEAGKVRAL